MLAKGGLEVVQVSWVGVLDKEVIHHKCKEDGVGVVFEKSWGDSSFFIASCFEAWEEEITGHFASLWEPIHPFVNFGIDVAMFVNIVLEVVLIPDGSGDGLCQEAHILGIGEGVVQIEVLNVNASCSGSWGGDDIVDEAFDRD